MSNPKKNFVENDAELRSLCRRFTRKNVETLGGWATSDSVNEDLKMRAIIVLLDRGWGRPAQDNSHDVNVKGQLEITLRKLLSGEPKEEDDGQ